MAKIDDVISSLTTKIIELEKRQAKNITMRIDDVIAYLEEAKSIAEGAKNNQKFDLVESVSANATVTYAVGTKTITAGNDVLKYGDELEVTVTADEGYEIDTFTINGESAVSGSKITVVENVEVVVTTEVAPTEP